MLFTLSLKIVNEDLIAVLGFSSRARDVTLCGGINVCGALSRHTSTSTLLSLL